MQHDEVIWQVIRHNHCSFMTKIETGIFCRNPYNLTGVCNRSSCPLANSRYATVREDKGVFYLYMKSIERAHVPNKLWERVKLPRNYERALEVIDKHLMYWPKFLVHKAKQRLTKMTQMRIRMRKLSLKTREKIMTVPTKLMRREARREEKAEKAAVLDKSIEKELIERLKTGMYGDIYNYPFSEFEGILIEKEVEEDVEEEAEIEYVDGNEELEEEDMEDLGSLRIQKTGADEATVGMEDDNNKDTSAGERKRQRKNFGVSQRRSEKDGPKAKAKKKSKLLEVEREDRDERQTALL